MPGFDGTGPRGQGAMTGGGMGYCAGNSVDFGRMPSPGRRLFMGRGAGRGYRNCFYATGLPGWVRGRGMLSAAPGASGAVAKESELEVLKNQAGFLKEELEAVSARISELENRGKGV